MMSLDLLLVVNAVQSSMTVSLLLSLILQISPKKDIPQTSPGRDQATDQIAVFSKEKVIFKGTKNLQAIRYLNLTT